MAYCHRMTGGCHFAMTRIIRGKFFRMGQKVGISEKVIDLELAKLSRKITVEATKLKGRLSKKYPAEVYEKIQRGIEARLAQLSM
ncbi:MAG: hypothetical protein GX927_05580 [Lentisphaerae bacterium]|nr:hypothetical protein [Lentisphaerota bacterium]